VTYQLAQHSWWVPCKVDGLCDCSHASPSGVTGCCSCSCRGGAACGDRVLPALGTVPAWISLAHLPTAEGDWRDRRWETDREANINCGTDS
jgi:hypothetical protein